MVDNKTKGEYVIPDQVNKEIRWTPAKVALFAAMRKLKAVDASSACSAEKIAKATNGKLEENQVNHQCNPAFDLTAQGVIASTKLEGERNKSFYLTKKGQKADTTPASAS